MGNSFCPPASLACRQMTPPGAFTRAELPQLVGLTARQIKYLAEQGVVRPSLRPSFGRGSPTLYGIDDLHRLAVIGALSRLFGRGDRGEVQVSLARAVCETLATIERPWHDNYLLIDSQRVVIRTEAPALERALQRSGELIAIDLGRVSETLTDELAQPQRRAAA